jgi:2,3-dihydroxy-2,3-dihydrophenylpropionate dehydrogenase
MVDPAGVRERAADRAVLVTGGSSGIGRAVVEAFLAQGDHVVVLDRSAPPFEADRLTAVVGDVTKPADNERAVHAALEACGRLDVFIGNAGVHDGGVAIADLPIDELGELARAVLDVNVVGLILGARACTDPLTNSGGCMIFTLSDASYVVQGNGSGVAYAAAKHGALGVLRSLAADLAPHVRVNGVAPGGVITNLQAVDVRSGERSVFEDPAAIAAAVREFNPLGVVLSPDELAPLYVLLASEAARGMTGEVLRPDGGLGVR